MIYLIHQLNFFAFISAQLELRYEKPRFFLYNFCSVDSDMELDNLSQIITFLSF